MLTIDYLGMSNAEKVNLFHLKDYLRDRHIIMVKNFPTNMRLMFNFCSILGTPMLKINAQGNELVDYIGDVRVRLDIESNHRMPTQSSGYVQLHSARAYANLRTRIFCMLKVHIGLDGPNKKGESIFIVWNEFIKDYVGKYQALGIQDIDVIMNTPVNAMLDSYAKYYSEKDISNEPLIKVNKDGIYSVRYWVDMIKTVENYVKQNGFSGSQRYLEAMLRFDKAVQNYHGIVKYFMEQGDLVVLNNSKIAHGRLPFLESKTVQGAIVVSSRQIYNMHLL